MMKLRILIVKEEQTQSEEDENDMKIGVPTENKTGQHGMFFTFLPYKFQCSNMSLSIVTFSFIVYFLLSQLYIVKCKDLQMCCH